MVRAISVVARKTVVTSSAQSAISGSVQSKPFGARRSRAAELLYYDLITITPIFSDPATQKKFPELLDTGGHTMLVLRHEVERQPL